MAKSRPASKSEKQKLLAGVSAPANMAQVQSIQGNPFNPAMRGKVASVVTGADLTKEYVAASRVWYPFLRSLPNAFDELTKEFGMDIYARMMHDAEVASSAGVLILACLSNGYKVLPSVDPSHPDYEIAKRAADMVQFSCDGMGTPFLAALEQLLDGLWMGSAVSENTWRIVDNGEWKGKWIIADVKSKPLDLITLVVDAYNNVVGVGARQQAGQVIGMGSAFPVDFEEVNQIPGLLPRLNFTIFTWNMKGNDPRGQSILRPAYSAWWFKQQVINEYLAWITRFAQPSIVGITAPNAQPIPLKDANGQIMYDSNGQPICESPQKSMRAGLDDVKSGSTISIPHGADVKLLQIMSDGSAFQKALDWADRQITRAILHQHLATGEGQHQSRAAGQVHQDVLGMLIMYVKQMLCTTIQRDMFQPMVALNMGEDMVKYTPKLDLGMGDGFPLTALDISRLHSTGYFSDDQLPTVDMMLGLPIRDKMDSLRQRVGDEIMGGASKPGTQPMSGVAGNDAAGGGNAGSASGDPEVDMIINQWLSSQSADDEDEDVEPLASKDKNKPASKPGTQNEDDSGGDSEDGED